MLRNGSADAGFVHRVQFRNRAGAEVMRLRGSGYVPARSSTGEAEDCLSTGTYPEPLPGARTV